jgi:polysaccharide pyruvyl transferase WcaK-like protein
LKEYGLFKDGNLIEKFETLEESYEPLKNFNDRTGYVFRKLHFNELSENEKLNKMETQLTELSDFLKMAKGSGRTIQSHTKIYEDEMEWLLSYARKAIESDKSSLE